MPSRQRQTGTTTTTLPDLFDENGFPLPPTPAPRPGTVANGKAAAKALAEAAQNAGKRG